MADRFGYGWLHPVTLSSVLADKLRLAMLKDAGLWQISFVQFIEVSYVLYWSGRRVLLGYGDKGQNPKRLIKK